MSDFADHAEAHEQRLRDDALEKARRAAAEIPAGGLRTLWGVVGSAGQWGVRPVPRQVQT